MKPWSMENIFYWNKKLFIHMNFSNRFFIASFYWCVINDFFFISIKGNKNLVPGPFMILLKWQEIKI